MPNSTKFLIESLIFSAEQKYKTFLYICLCSKVFQSSCIFTPNYTAKMFPKIFLIIIKQNSEQSQLNQTNTEVVILRTIHTGISIKSENYLDHKQIHFKVNFFSLNIWNSNKWFIKMLKHQAYVITLASHLPINIIISYNWKYLMLYEKVVRWEGT